MRVGANSSAVDKRDHATVVLNVRAILQTVAIYSWKC